MKKGVKLGGSVPPPPPSIEGGGLPKVDKARSNMLSSIEGFNSKKLKKAVTNDRSQPILDEPKEENTGGRSGMGGMMEGIGKVQLRTSNPRSERSPRLRNRPALGSPPSRSPRASRRALL